jgi:hypothetical protein
MMLKCDKKKLVKIKSQSAFSFVELMFSLMMLIIILVGLMYTYVVCFKLNNSSRDLTLANNALQAEFESIKETPFDDLVNLNGEIIYDLSGFSQGDAVGVVNVIDPENDGYEDLRYIRLVVCWKDANNRIIGEASDSTGVLEPVDHNGDGGINSPAELVTLVSRTE